MRTDVVSGAKFCQNQRFHAHLSLTSSTGTGKDIYLGHGDFTIINSSGNKDENLSLSVPDGGSLIVITNKTHYDGS